MRRAGISGSAAVVVIVALVVGLGIGYAATVTFIPSATRTNTASTTLSATETTSLAPVTVTSTVDLQPTLGGVPKVVTVDGQFSTKSNSTTAAAIRFVSQSSVSYTAQVSSGGGYIIVNLPNEDTYTVKIDYTSPTGGGTCTAGTLPVYLQVAEVIQANWSC